MIHKGNISKWIILLPILVIVITSIVLITFFIEDTKQDFKNNLQNIKAKKLGILKNSIQDRVLRIINVINTENDLRLKMQEKEIKNFTYLGYKIIKTTHETYKHLPKNQIIEKIKNRLRDMRFFKNNKGYFYVHSLDGMCYLMPPKSSLEGKNLLDVKSKDGKYIFKEPFDQVYKIKDAGLKEGSIVHHIQMPNESLLKKKRGYIKFYEPLNLFVGTGKYYEDMDSETKSDILKLLNTIRFDYYNYLFVLNENGKILAHRDSTLVGTYGKNSDTLKNIIYKILRASKNYEGGFVSYNYENPINHNIEQKITFVKKYDPYGWILGTGSHTSKIEDEIAQEKTQMDKELAAMVQNIIILSTIFTIFIIIVFVIISWKVKSILLEREKVLDKKNKELYHSSYYDQLTSLYNRNRLLEDLSKNTAKELLLIDIDRFSHINDIYGLEIGDSVIKRVANIIQTVTPKNCKLYRVTSDIFAIVSFDDKESESVCSLTAYNIIEAINQNPIDISIDNFNVEIIISVTLSMAQKDSSNKLFEHANMAINFAKNRKKQFVIYSSELGIEKRYQDDLYSVMITKKALSHNLIEPFFQPIVKKDGTISYESLVRIVDEGTIIPPAMFIDKIKTTKYYKDLTKVMIVKTFDYFKDKACSFSINLSFEDISDSKLTDFLKFKIKEYEVEKKLIIEILESESIQNFEIVNRFTQSLKKLGVRIAIDDFGSGYSNFSYLLRLRPDFIKIDGSLIKNIDIDKKSHIIVKNIIALANELDIEIIAEFIHSRSVYKTVKNLGAHGLQGYYFSPPVKNIEKLQIKF